MTPNRSPSWTTRERLNENGLVTWSQTGLPCPLRLIDFGTSQSTHWLKVNMEVRFSTGVFRGSSLLDAPRLVFMAVRRVRGNKVQHAGTGKVKCIDCKMNQIDVYTIRYLSRDRSSFYTLLARSPYYRSPLLAHDNNSICRCPRNCLD